MERFRNSLDAQCIRLYLRCKQLLPWLRGLQQLPQALAALQHGRGHSYLELAGYELAFGTSDRPCLFEDDVVLTQSRRAQRQRCGYVHERDKLPRQDVLLRHTCTGRKCARRGFFAEKVSS